jgi:glycerophosphoryl diester phosphodiesterase
VALKLPPIIGHRGACAYAPENTLESIRTAYEMGVKWVELDVKLTADSVPILFHDDDLDRTTNGHGAVAQTRWRDIQDLEAGSWFSEGFAGIRVPTLEETLDVLMHYKMGVNLEIKPCAGREVETAESMLDLLTQSWDERDNILISSFSHVSLETTKDMAEDFPRALLLDDEWPKNWLEIAEYLEVPIINISNSCNREQVELVIDSGRQVFVYTVDDPQRAKQLRQWGVDGVFTNDPDAITPALFRMN